MTAHRTCTRTVRRMTRTRTAALLTLALLAGCAPQTTDVTHDASPPSNVTTPAPAPDATAPADPDTLHAPEAGEPAADPATPDSAASDTAGETQAQTPTDQPQHENSTDTADETPDTLQDDRAVELWPVTRIIDGDTIEVSSPDGARERVRLIGIDTPERGECGFDAATDRMRQMVQGRNVTLTPGARSDRDRFGRLLRYVDVDGIDTGYTLIVEGLAISRYDSRDGFGEHPREAQYIAADLASTHPLCPAG